MKRSLTSRVVTTLTALLIMAVHIVPFYIMITVAFKARGDRSSRWIPPLVPVLENFAIAIQKGKLDVAILNTAIITVCSVLLVTLLGAMAAYPLSRVKSRFNTHALSLIVAVMMVPPLSVLVPLYRLMVGMGGINQYWGIILVSITYNLPMSIYLYTNFIASIPKALDEAALIDGCTRFSIFHRIILPSLKPVTASVVILTGVTIWNDFSFQLYFLQKPAMRTVTLAISSFFTENASNLNAAAAAALLAVLAPVVIYLTMQKYFVQGVVDSSVK